MRTAEDQRGYILGVLIALIALYHVDRQLMSLLLEPVRAEFSLSDVQLGLLSGLAFAAIYTTLSIPAAVWAVHRSRRNLISAAAVIWGAMTVFCGATQSFWQIFFGRFGVGLGEAGCQPAAQAMISDLYPREERATAQACLAAGANIGVFLAFLVGGYAASRFGWRVAFYIGGAATVALAILIRLSVREPKAARNAESLGSAALVRETAHAMWSDRALRHICIGATLTSTVGFGAVTWLPSFLARSHDMNIATVGAYLAAVVGIGGAIGAALGGWLSDVARRRDVRWSLWVVAAALAAAKPLSVVSYLLDDTRLALVLFILPAMVGTIFLGPSIAVLHGGIRSNLRPIASAILSLLINLIGLGLGPLLVGAMSQYLFAAAGADSLRYALVVLQVAGLWGALHYFFAGQNLRPATALAKPAV